MNAALSTTRRKKAFTLIELLIVIGIIAILAGLLLPVLSRSKEHAFRANDVSNMRQIMGALEMYSHDNGDRLPVFPSQGTWLWDLDAGAADIITDAGAKRKILYCPALTESVKDLDVWWYYPTGLGTSTHRVTGYGWMIKRSTGNLDANLQPGKQFVDRTVSGNLITADVEVVFDAVLSVGLTDFLNVTSTSGIVGTHKSAHMDHGSPAGGNIGFLDGHATWRRFQSMQCWYNTTDRDIRFWF